MLSRSFSYAPGRNTLKFQLERMWLDILLTAQQVSFAISRLLSTQKYKKVHKNFVLV